MELRVLSYFLMVAREQNITKAANVLHITQPTLSRQLSQLEEELGVKLFERRKHSIELTEAGLLLRRRAQEIVQLRDKIYMEVSPNTEELSGIITIGAGELRSFKELSLIIHAFQAEHPLVHFEIVSGDAQELILKLEQGLVDLCLLIEPVAIDRYNFIRMKGKERWGILVDEETVFAKQATVQASDLKDTSVIYPRNSAMNRELAQWFGDYAETINPISVYNLLYNNVILAQESKEIVVCLDLGVTYEQMKFIPFEPALECSSVLTWKAGTSASAAINEFISFSKKYLKSI